MPASFNWSKSTWMDENSTTDIDIDYLYGQENPT
jgi:2-methylaconitate cis-trans-isomerase PrpF